MFKTRHFRISIIMLSAAFGLLTACADVSVKKAVENERKNLILGELVNMRRDNGGIADLQSVELFTFKSQPIYSLGKSYAEPPKTGVDYSQINTLYDAFGNKTETRCLENDPLVRCVVVKTSAAGQKQATVFGVNGEVKRLPDEETDKLMIAAGSKIAAVAGIYEQPKIEQTKIETPKFEPVISETVLPLNQSAAILSPTPEIPAAEQSPQIAETTKTVEIPETKQTKFAAKPETIADNAAAPSKIKVDSLWLNNNPPKKKQPQQP